jgi:uncharacterized membrane protein YqgA involved in biofilm formation
MGTRISTARIVAFASVIVSAILGVYLGSITYRYEVIVRGVLGIAVMYLCFKMLWSSKEDSIEDYYPVSKIIRYFIFVCLAGIIFYWASQQALEMIFFYLEK